MIYKRAIITLIPGCNILYILLTLFAKHRCIQSTESAERHFWHAEAAANTSLNQATVAHCIEAQQEIVHISGSAKLHLLTDRGHRKCREGTEY